MSETLPEDARYVIPSGNPRGVLLRVCPEPGSNTFFYEYDELPAVIAELTEALGSDHNGGKTASNSPTEGSES